MRDPIRDIIQVVTDWRDIYGVSPAQMIWRVPEGVINAILDSRETDKRIMLTMGGVAIIAQHCILHLLPERRTDNGQVEDR